MSDLKQLPSRISTKIEPDENGCWLWLAAKRDGYGLVRWDGKMRPAHRVVYEILSEDIPEGLECDHLCRVRHCVNPEHIEPVTHRENLLRGEAPSAQGARTTHCPQGHLYDEENTYSPPVNNRRECRACRKARTPDRVRANRERRERV